MSEQKARSVFVFQAVDVRTSSAIDTVSCVPKGVNLSTGRSLEFQRFVRTSGSKNLMPW
jgi:hypothetical protein